MWACRSVARPTIGVLTTPADKVQPPVERETERSRVFAAADVYGGIPVCVEDKPVRRVEAAALSLAAFPAARPAILLTRVLWWNCFHPLAAEWCLVRQDLPKSEERHLGHSVVVPLPLVSFLCL